MTARAWDDIPNYNTTGLGLSIIRDDTRPEISNALINGNTSISVIAGTILTLTATIDDTGSGLPEGANYTIGYKTWSTSQPLSATDGSWNSPSETASATIDTTNWGTGTHFIFLSAWDVADLPNQNISGANVTITVRPSSSASGGGDVKFADFTFTVTGKNVQFEYTGTKGEEYRWSFGDNRGSNETNPAHRYDNYNKPDETYLVRVEVTLASGQKLFKQKEVYVPAQLVDVYEQQINVGWLQMSGAMIMFSAIVMFVCYKSNIEIIVKKEWARGLIPLWFLFGLGLTMNWFVGVFTGSAVGG
jgi:hypothetical protein